MSLGPRLFLGFWLFFMIAGRSRLFKDPGTFWHTRVGDLVLERGYFKSDPFTFTHAGQHWIPHQWLGEVGMALAYRVAGLDTFLLLAATLLASLFTWLTLRLTRTGLHVSVAGVIACVVLAATATHLHVRPILATTVFLAVFTALLTDFDDGRMRLARLLWLLPLTILWTNLHGGVLGGLASFGLVIVGWITWTILGWPTPVRSKSIAFRLMALLAVCCLSVLINPYFLVIPTTWLKIMQGSRIAAYLEEHQPLDPASPNAFGLLALAALYLAVLAGTLPRRPQVTWLLPLFWLLQSVFRVRHAPLFAMTAFVAIASMWPHTIYARRLLKRPDLYDPQRAMASSLRAWLMPACVVLITFILQISSVTVPVFGAGWAQSDPARWPVSLVLRIRECPPGDVFTDLNLGGWLSFQASQFKTFIDDRVELYSDDFLDDYIAGSGDGGPAAALPRWEARYGRFPYALVQPRTPFANYFANSPDWKLVAEDAAGQFYERQDHSK